MEEMKQWLSLSLEVEDNSYQKVIWDPNSKSGIYKVNH